MKLLLVDNLLDVNSMERILDGLLLNYNRICGPVKSAVNSIFRSKYARNHETGTSSIKIGNIRRCLSVR